MIPKSEILESKLSPGISSYMLLNKSNYFQKADRFIELTKLFTSSSIIDKLSLWYDMIVQPIYTLISCLFYGGEFSVFTIFDIQKCIGIWKEWFEFKQLAFEIRQWMKIVQTMDGPFISTNDATYHVYVYADAMERLSIALKERVKKAFRPRFF